MTFVSELEPQALWKHFDDILAIPRPSKGEERMRRHVVERAEALGLEVRQDEAGNVVVVKPAAAGCEGAPIVILQAHLDMVQEKNSDVDFDFTSDAIRPLREDGYLTAEGTTLGSDNGIGVAAMLALMEADDVAHGPLELLFTIDEETGLTGASQLDPSLLEGRRLLNMDSEEEGELCVGCAGGADSTVTLPVAVGPAAAGAAALAIRVYGLKGGHSGVDIHLQRGNAIQILARALDEAAAEHGLALAEISGGSAHNAIPREAAAVAVVEPDALAAARAAIEGELEAIRGELADADPGLAWEIAERPAPETACDAASTRRALALLVALPHGVARRSDPIPSLVETSNNLATVALEDGGLRVHLSSRSSVASALVAHRQKIRAVAALAGAAVEDEEGYPGWQPDMDSELLGIMKRLHAAVLGEEPGVGAVHAGLECGLIGAKIPGMDMISFGPQIEFPHSPDERVQIDSVGRFWRLLVATLEELGKPA